MNDHVFQIYIMVYRFTLRWFGDTAIWRYPCGLKKWGATRSYELRVIPRFSTRLGDENQGTKKQYAIICQTNKTSHESVWANIFESDFFHNISKDIHRHQSGFVLVFNMIRCHPVFVHMVSEIVRKSPTESVVIFSAAMLLEATPRDAWQMEALGMRRFIRDEHGRELT